MKRLKKIGKALKTVLLSLFHMDLQIDIEEEEDLSKLKVSKFKSAFILLTITTILWIIVFYTFREYFFIMGITLSAGWLGFIVVAIGKFLERKKRTKSKEKIRMKVSKFRIAVLVLLVATVIYVVAFIQSAMAYQSWKHESLLMADFAPNYPPFLASKFGRSYLFPAIALMLTWMFIVPATIFTTKDWKTSLAAFFLISAVCIPSFIVITRA